MVLDFYTVIPSFSAWINFTFCDKSFASVAFFIVVFLIFTINWRHCFRTRQANFCFLPINAFDIFLESYYMLEQDQFIILSLSITIENVSSHCWPYADSWWSQIMDYAQISHGLIMELLSNNRKKEYQHFARHWKHISLLRKNYTSSRSAMISLWQAFMYEFWYKFLSRKSVK